MPLGVVSPEQFNDELIKSSIPIGKVVDIKRGRGAVKEIPECIRETIAEEAIQGAPSKLLQETFGVSPASIAAYKNGATSTSTYHQPNQSLMNHVNDVKEDISDKARGRLLVALDSLTTDKISSARAKDIAGIAKDMSSVMANMEPKVGTIINGPQVLVYRPRLKDDSDFEVIYVNEDESVASRI